MAFEVIFSERAAKEFRALDRTAQQRIIKKLKDYSQSENLSAAKRLTNPSLGTWRYRIGDYRVVFDLIGKQLQVLKIGKRSEVYE